MADRVARPYWSSRFLPGAVALAALGLALASPACGGNVVVDGHPTGTAGTTGGSGGSGGSASTGTAPGGAGGGGGFVGTSNGGASGVGGASGCTVDPMPPQVVMQGCVTGDVCPAANTPEANAL